MLAAEAIRPLFEISTAHLPEHVDAALDTAEGVEAYATEFGWFVYVPEFELDRLAREHGWPVDLVTIMKCARDNGSAWIRLDADGPMIEDLPTFDW